MTFWKEGDTWQNEVRLSEIKEICFGGKNRGLVLDIGDFFIIKLDKISLRKIVSEING